MDEYGIVYLLPDDIARYHVDLWNKVEQKFNLTGKTKLNAPSHITLKYRFEAHNILEVENAISTFCVLHHPPTWSLNRFNFFNNDAKFVIFIDVDATEYCRQTHAAFLDTLRPIQWMRWGEFDHSNLHYHVTLAHRGLNAENFEEVWQFVNTQPKPYFDLRLDNITLLKIENNNHSIYRKFTLKK